MATVTLTSSREVRIGTAPLNIVSIVMEPGSWELTSLSAALMRAVPASRVIAFGHLGDGNLHFNLSQPLAMPKTDFLIRQAEVNQIVHTMVVACGGSVAAEHGVGQLKRELLAAVKDPVALDVMRTIKRALDPKGILNPGKVL